MAPKTYFVTDSNTGKRYKLTGEAPPTQSDLEELFPSATPQDTITSVADKYLKRAENRPNYLQSAGQGLREIGETMIASPILQEENKLKAVGQSVGQTVKRGFGLAKVVGAPGAAISAGIGSSLIRMQEDRAHNPRANVASVMGSGLLGLGRGLVGLDKTTFAEAMEARGMASPAAFLLDAVVAGKADPLSRVIGGPAAQGTEKALSKAYLGVKAKTLSWLVRHPREKISHIIATKGSGARDFLKGGENATANAAQDLANELESNLNKYIYEPATKMWDDLTTKAAKIRVPFIDAAKLRTRIRDEVAKDPTPYDDEIIRLVDDELMGPRVRSVLEGGQPVGVELDILRMHRRLRMRARRDPAAAKAADIVGEYLASTNPDFKPASDAWKIYSDSRKAAHVLYGGYSKEVKGASVGREGERLALDPKRLLNFLEEADRGQYVGAAKTLAQNLENATKAKVASTAAPTAVSKSVARARAKALARQQKLTQQRPQLPGQPQLPSPPGGPLTTLYRKKESMGVPPGKSVVTGGAIDAEAVGSTVPPTSPVGPVIPGTGKPAPTTITADDVIKRIKDVSAYAGLESDRPMLSGLSYAGGAGAAIGGALGTIGLPAGLMYGGLSGLAGWIFKEAVPHANIRSLANTRARYAVIKDMLNRPMAKAAMNVTGLDSRAYGELIMRGSYDRAVAMKSSKKKEK